MSTTEGPDGRARLLYSATMSLDGYISGPAGDQAWLARHLGPNPLIDDLVEAVAVAQAAARGTKYVNVLSVSTAAGVTNLWFRVGRLSAYPPRRLGPRL